MNITQRDRDLGTGYAMKPSTDPDRTDRGRPRHADGRAAAPLLASGRPRGRCRRDTPQPGARAGRGPDPVPRRAAAGAGLVHAALLPSRHHALLRQGRGARHPLLLSRLAVRRRRPLPRAALRARTAAVQRQRCASPGIRSQERYGLVFAYLGPPEKKPVLPRYECLEVMDAGEFVEADDSVDRRRRHRRSCPATGCSISRTWSIPTTCRCCTARFSGAQFVAT